MATNRINPSPFRAQEEVESDYVTKGDLLQASKAVHDEIKGGISGWLSKAEEDLGIRFSKAISKRFERLVEGEFKAHLQAEFSKRLDAEVSKRLDTELSKRLGVLEKSYTERAGFLQEARGITRRARHRAARARRQRRTGRCGEADDVRHRSGSGDL